MIIDWKNQEDEGSGARKVEPRLIAGETVLRRELYIHRGWAVNLATLASGAKLSPGFET